MKIRGGSGDEWDDDDPAVIAARAAARRDVLQARAQLHPVAQVVLTLQEGFINLVANLGCLLLILIIVLALFAPGVIQAVVQFFSGGR